MVLNEHKTKIEFLQVLTMLTSISVLMMNRWNATGVFGCEQDMPKIC